MCCYQVVPQTFINVMVGVELEKQLEELQIAVGLRCLSVLRYLTDHTGVLSLGVLAR